MRTSGTAYKLMSVDELREKIQIVYYPELVDDEGNYIKSKVPVIRWEGFAKVLPIASKIVNSKNEIINEVDYRIIIRFREDIEYSDFVIYRKKKLSMLNVPFDLENRRQWLQMDCKELKEK